MMIGLGALGPMDEVQAVIKAKVGEFLQAEQKIRKYLAHPSASVRNDAVGLLTVQKRLEVELGDAQSKIAQFQSGAWSIADVLALGDFGTRLVQHLKNVTRLEQSASGVQMPSTGVPDYAVPVFGAVAVAAVALWAFARR